MHFFLDHDWMPEYGEALPVYRPPLDYVRHFGDAGARARPGRPEITVRYLTPHSKWSIHSEYQDNLHMLPLFRGGPVIWMSPVDAEKIGVADNDWIEAYNRNGVVACRAVVSHRMPEGTVFMYHAKDRHLMTPKLGDLRLARRRRQLADPAGDQADPHDRRLRPVLLRLQLLRPDRQPARRGHRDPPPRPGGRVLMQGAWRRSRW